MPTRLVLLHRALAALGIDSTTAYEDPVGFVTRLHPTLLAESPPLYRPEIASHAAWDRRFPGSRQVYYLEEDWFGYYANMDRPSRLAAPDRVLPAAYGMAVGGTLLTKLERDVFVPGATEESGPG